VEAPCIVCLIGKLRPGVTARATTQYTFSKAAQRGQTFEREPCLLLSAFELGADRAGPQAVSLSTRSILARSCRTALVWIWQTRLSVTPSTWPISASVKPS